METEDKSSGMRCNWEARNLAKWFKKLGCEGDRREKIRRVFLRWDRHKHF